jgi:16S rRNA (cytosine967-C5)-methyltransferase
LPPRSPEPEGELKGGARLTRPLVGMAAEALSVLLRFSGPADEILSRYFRAHRSLGRRDRAFIAESTFAVLRRKRSLEHAAGSAEPRALLLAGLLRVLGLSGRALDPVIGAGDLELIARVRGTRVEDLPPAVRADLPDWLWARLVGERGENEALAIAQGMLNAAPLDLRVNLARLDRDAALARLEQDEIAASRTPFSPAGLRLPGKPAINRHPLFIDGLVEVQDEGSQLLGWVVAPRRGEMIADYCAGAGGKTLALSMLMRGTGRIYAMDISAPRLAALGPRAARAGVTNVHTIALAGENDARAKRLAAKMDRVLVDAPCSGFGTLRRNPDFKWRQDARTIEELSAKQRRILAAAARLVKPGGRLVYATCSILQVENGAVADDFLAAHGEFRPISCAEILRSQRIDLEASERLQLWPHLHHTDGFFAAVFERVG